MEFLTAWVAYKIRGVTAPLIFKPNPINYVTNLQTKNKSMKILLPEYGLTYDTLTALFPSSIKDLYQIEHNKELNTLRIGPKDTIGVYAVSVSLKKVHLIKSDEVTMDIMADGFYLTIFLNVDYVYLQTF